MFKTLLAGAATLAALPVIAQTGNPTTNTPAGATTTPNTVEANNTANTTSQVPVSTTTNDHSMHDDNVAGTTSNGAYTQVNGGVSTSATGTPGMAASDTTLEGADASTPTSVANGSMDAQGSMANRTMSGEARTYAGVGGPAEGMRDYPACSRTVTDSCMQRGGR